VETSGPGPKETELSTKTETRSKAFSRRNVAAGHSLLN